MKTKLMAAVLLVIFAGTGQICAIDLIPQPVEMKILDGSTALTRESTIAFNKPEGREIAEMLARRLRVPTGFQFQTRQGQAATIQLRLNDAPNPNIGNEGYVLEAQPEAVVISANRPAGLFYGTQTLVQLLPPEIEGHIVANTN